MKADKHYGYFRDGKLKADTFKEALRRLTGKPVVLTVSEFRETRSNQANRYYWGVVVELIHDALNDAGWEVTKEGTHDMLKFRFLREDKPIGNDGEFITTIKSTSELDTMEFGEYIEHCCRFAAEYLNTVIPPPGEQQELKAA